MAKDSSKQSSSSAGHQNPHHHHQQQPKGEGHSTGGISNDANSHSSNQPSQPRFKKVFIQRDYSHGTAVRFQTAFPNELEGYIDPESFQYLVTNVNLMYGQGEKMSGRTFCESCCACLTAYCLYMCIESYYDKCARKVGDFIAEQNDLRWKRRGLLVTDPLERGLRVIEITIFLDKAEGLRGSVGSASGASNVRTQQPSSQVS